MIWYSKLLGIASIASISVVADVKSIYRWIWRGIFILAKYWWESMFLLRFSFVSYVLAIVYFIGHLRRETFQRPGDIGAFFPSKIDKTTRKTNLAKLMQVSRDKLLLRGCSIFLLAHFHFFSSFCYIHLIRDFRVFGQKK